MPYAINALSAEPEEAPRVYSYTRFSTPEQAEGDSKRRQSEGARRWMERKNAERTRELLPPLAFDERLNLTDLGVSAFRGANVGEDKGLGGFLLACRMGLIPAGSYLVVESLDRVSRMTPRRVSRILDDIVDAGVVIATLSDGQEYDAERLDSDPTALLIALIVSWRAHEESKVKGQRLSAAWAEKRQRVRDGRDAKLTSKGPSWLQWTPSGWQEHPTNADTVRRIFRMTLEGIGEHKIAQELNAQAVPVMGRGKMWHRSTIAKVLRSPSVIGTLLPGRMDHSEGRKVRKLEQPIAGAFPAVVSIADWTASAGSQGRQSTCSARPGRVGPSVEPVGRSGALPRMRGKHDPRQQGKPGERRKTEARVHPGQGRCSGPRLSIRRPSHRADRI